MNILCFVQKPPNHNLRIEFQEPLDSLLASGSLGKFTVLLKWIEKLDDEAREIDKQYNSDCEYIVT